MPDAAVSLCTMHCNVWHICAIYSHFYIRLNNYSSNKSAGYFEKLAKRGLVTGKEAGEFLEEVEEDIFHVLQCRHSTHKDELTEGARETRLRTLPTYMLNDLLGVSGEGVNAKLPDIAEDEWKEDCEVAV